MRAGLAIICLLGLAAAARAEPVYPWLEGREPASSLAERIPPPAGYQRVDGSSGSFSEWLQHLPLKPGKPPVYLYDGRLKGNQEAHVAVLDLDVGRRDLQQCADAVMRLRGEFLFAVGQPERIHFNFTSGDRADFQRWATGWRPVVRGSSVRWSRSAEPDPSHASLRRYLDKVFELAGSASLSRELKPVDAIQQMQVGDVFIQGGFPGHAVIVLDLATATDGKLAFLLAQSYMPAQEMHVLHNPAGAPMDPWYRADFGETLVTPEWTFRRTHLMRFD